MKRLTLQVISLVLMASFSSFASAGSKQSPVTKIVSVIALEGDNILRIQVRNDFSFNPGTCDVGPDTVDIQLDIPGRSAEEQRLLLNAVYLAFMTNRNVILFIRDDICSTAATSLRLRVANGVWVLD